MQLDVPYYSQHDETLEKKHREGACAIACLRMALSFLSGEPPSLQELFNEGRRIGGQTADGLWIHAKLAMLARNHGLPAYNQEFRSNSQIFAEQLVEEGITKITASLMHGYPVLVSVPGSRTKSLVSTHIVLLVGCEAEEGFYYHDPDARSNEEGAFQLTSLETFKKEWRKLAIFVH